MRKRYVETKSRGLTLRGYLELPDSASAENPVPLLVMFHGFTGTLSEKHFLLSRLSRTVVARGIATLRFDFGGSGESDGEFLDVTPATEIEDGRAIIAFAQTLEEVNHERTGLFGFSLGGFVATNVAVRESDRLRGLILLSPGAKTHLKMKRLLEQTGRCGRGSLVLTEQFVADGLANDALKAAASFSKPTRIIQGTADAAVPHETAALYAKTFPDARVTYIEGADHAYDTPEHFEEMSKAVVSAVQGILLG